MPSERGQVVDNESHRKRLETISQVSFNVVYMLKARCRINGGSDQTQPPHAFHFPFTFQIAPSLEFHLPSLFLHQTFANL
ncbi:Uncharacterized protein HZ326_3378 [Fusarium oxysporum f. sp. albedinis]|nr:Uncharacterized protein HZ326_3378 [Fusarium oxysporum f. sp. albedinis]